MRDWNTGDENGLNSVPSYLDWIDIDDEFLNRDNPKKDCDNDDLDDVPF
ncbi:hypothetical protein [Moraxella equi]|uniref:Uncharacterized protein n=1 Tax=Moraxella equi TaxID=60442 RepID=A0A378QQ21_9GAMM|nr:hypothetical protein [Moraxella equi]STZ02996.1 Uncharacterised protein [Moraxella equi]STZ03010.1 Uncharacterised protein [Moraxella equi]